MSPRLHVDGGIGLGSGGERVGRQAVMVSPRCVRSGHYKGEGCKSTKKGTKVIVGHTRWGKRTSSPARSHLPPARAALRPPALTSFNRTCRADKTGGATLPSPDAERTLLTMQKTMVVRFAATESRENRIFAIAQISGTSLHSPLQHVPTRTRAQKAPKA